MKHLIRKFKEPKVGYYALMTYNCEVFFQPSLQNRTNIWSEDFLSLPVGGCYLVVDIGQDEKNRSIMKLLINSNVVNVPMHMKNSMLFIKPTSFFEEKNFCITGKLSYDRKIYEKIIELNGGYYKNFMNNNIDFLLTNGSHQTSKIEKAKSIGSAIISENKFWELISKK
jgi:NAD-dependent DNA ligase